MNREEFDNSLYVRPSGREEREAREKSNTRRFWFFCVPGGASARVYRDPGFRLGRGILLGLAGVYLSDLWA